MSASPELRSRVATWLICAAVPGWVVITPWVTDSPPPVAYSYAPTHYQTWMQASGAYWRAVAESAFTTARPGDCVDQAERALWVARQGPEFDTAAEEHWDTAGQALLRAAAHGCDAADLAVARAEWEHTTDLVDHFATANPSSS